MRQLKGAKYAWLGLSVLLLAQSVQAWQFVVGSERAAQKAEREARESLQLRAWLLHLNGSVSNLKQKLRAGDLLQRAFGQLSGEGQPKLPLLRMRFAPEADDFPTARMELLETNFLVIMLLMNLIMFVVLFIMYKAFRAHSLLDAII